MWMIWPAAGDSSTKRFYPQSADSYSDLIQQLFGTENPLQVSEQQDKARFTHRTGRP
jgi:hypothetical protein